MFLCSVFYLSISKHFTIKPHASLQSSKLLLFPFYRLGDWGIVRFNNLLKATKWVSCTTSSRPQQCATAQSFCNDYTTFTIICPTVFQKEKHTWTLHVWDTLSIVSTIFIFHLHFGQKACAVKALIKMPFLWTDSAPCACLHCHLGDLRLIPSWFSLSLGHLDWGVLQSNMWSWRSGRGRKSHLDQ